MSKNKLKFEFDFEDVFEGIKQGVIRELAEENFEDAKNEVIHDIKHEIMNNIRNTYSDDMELKKEVKQEVKKEVFEKLISDLNEKYLNSFNSYIEKQLSKNPDRLGSIERAIINELESKLYSDLYSSIMRKVEGELVKDVTNKFRNAECSTSTVQNNDEYISIKKSEYDELNKRDEILSSLEAYGVDNWEGYEMAMSDVDN